MRLSYTSLDTYQSCPLKYKFREIDKIAEPKSKEQVFGTLIHSVMHYLYTPSLLPPTLEQALDFFSKHWNSEIFENELEERAAFTEGVKMIQRHLSTENPADATVIDLESRFSIEVGNETDGIHTISGIIDRIDKTPDGYEIIDYKTTKKMPSQEAVDNNLQLSIYLKAFLKRYPKEIDHLDRITVSLYYLKHGVKLSSKRTKEQLDKVEEMFLDVVRSIEAKKFDPILSPLCDWCGYQKMCPLWKHKFAETRRFETNEVRDVIREYLDIKSRLSGEKLRLMQLQETLLGYMAQEQVDRVFDEAGIVSKTVRTTYKYDEEKLRAILDPLDQWENVLKVDGVALRSVLSSLPASVKKSVADAKVKDKESVSLSVKKAASDDSSGDTLTEGEVA